MSEENKALLQRWFEEVWNKGNAAAIGEMLADDVVIHGLSDATGAPITNITEFRAYHSQLRGAFPDIVVHVDDMIAEGDKVAARCSVQGNHQGELLGIAATNAGVDFKGMGFVRISNGKFVEVWNTFDFLTMSRQMGII